MFVLVCLVFTTSNSSCIYTVDGVSGNGQVITQERNVGDFNAISVGGAFELILSQGEKEALVIETDENLMEFIITEVRGNELIIKTEKNLRNFKVLKAYVTFRELESMDFSGAVEVSSEGKLVFSDLAIEASGATEITMQMEAESISMDLSGASEINFSGYCKSATIESSGASELDALDFETEDLTMEISGAGEARVFVTQSIDVSVSGAADIRYKGNPHTVNQNTSGAGSISKIE